MTERCVKGDYIGFTFGDVHSSELGLVRVSNGSRYEQDLLPPLQDKTAQVSGRDGVVYFNSQYNTRPIKVPVAFDNMTEESFQKLKELIMDKKPKYLWFDETPYKQWLVKAGGLQSFKWVCFDESKNIDRLDDGDSEGTKKRIYKGEGTLEFVCFTPYAESRILFLDEPVDYVWDWNRTESPKRLVQYFKEDEEYLQRKRVELNKELPVLTLECNYNFNEWKEVSGLRYKTKFSDIINISGTDHEIPEMNYNEWQTNFFSCCALYNNGDQPSNLYIYWNNRGVNSFPGDTLCLWNRREFWDQDLKKCKKIEIASFELQDGDTGIIIDSKMKIIKGIDSNGKITGNVYSRFHKGGDYFKVPLTSKKIKNDDYYYILESRNSLDYTKIDHTQYYI